VRRKGGFLLGSSQTKKDACVKEAKGHGLESLVCFAREKGKKRKERKVICGGGGTDAKEDPLNLFHGGKGESALTSNERRKKVKKEEKGTSSKKDARLIHLGGCKGTNSLETEGLQGLVGGLTLFANY